MPSMNWEQLDGPVWMFAHPVWAQRYLGNEVEYDFSVDVEIGVGMVVAREGNDEMDFGLEEWEWLDGLEGDALLDRLETDWLYQDRGQWIAPIRGGGL